MAEGHIRSVLHIQTRPGAAREVIAVFEGLGILREAARQDGFVSAALHAPVSGGSEVLVTALWRDEQAYEGWLVNPFRSAASEELTDLVDGDVDAVLYEVVQTQAPEGR